MQPARYKGAKGGRASGKSWFIAQYVVARMLGDVDLQVVCIREIQRSLKFSAKKLLEDTIRRMGASALFEVLQTEIRRKGGSGIIIFQGMQDHTADSIKSLESFDMAWCEEAQSLSHRSMELLVPTIRQDSSELLFSWNPEKETNAVERLFEERDDGIVVHVNYDENPWCPQSMKDEAARMRRLDPERFNHIWRGGFNKISDALVFRNKYSVREFEPGRDWNGPYYGLDFGFSNSPTAGVMCWVHGGRLWIEHEMEIAGLELDATADAMKRHLPGVERHVVRADSARPESISYLKRHGLPRIEGVKKGKGSVEDGIQFMRSFEEIVIHPRCENTEREFGSYSHKVDKLSGDVLPALIEEGDHIPDACLHPDTLITTMRGDIPISQVKSGDVVMTRLGWRKVIHQWIARHDAELVEVVVGARKLTCTPDHKIHTARGFVRADALRYNDEVTSLENLQWLKRWKLMASRGAVTQNHRAAMIAYIFPRGWGASAQRICTDIFTKRRTGQSRMEFTSIIKIMTRWIIASRIWRRSHQSSIDRNIQSQRKDTNNYATNWIALDRYRQNGIARKKDCDSIKRSARKHMKTSRQSANLACNAVKIFCQGLSAIVTSFVALHVNPPIVAIAGLTMSRERALNAEMNSFATSIRKRKRARDLVQIKWCGERADVYDIEVEDAHEFYANGVLVHNCRYALEPVMRQTAQPMIA